MKLLQEADVVLEEERQVGDAWLQHRDPLDSHPEREALRGLGVIGPADEPEDVRVDHPGAQDLDPARALAQRVALARRERARAVAAEARYVHLDARLGER